jgi:hypothetical protein
MFHNLVRNHAFGDWLAGRPLYYSSQVTQTTESELDKRSSREHPARLVITPSRNFIEEGRSSYRATIAAAGVVDDWRIWSRTDNGAAGAFVLAAADAVYDSEPGKRYSLAVTARCSVERNLLRVRVMGLSAAPAILYYLTATGLWAAADSTRGFQLSTEWRTFGVNWEAPEDAVTQMWQFSNGTAGAQVIDLDRIWMPMPLWDQGGEETGI